jgi:hypothetical protein
MESLSYIEFDDGKISALTAETITSKTLKITWSNTRHDEWLESFLMRQREYKIVSVLYGDNWVRFTLQR